MCVNTLKMTLNQKISELDRSQLLLINRYLKEACSLIIGHSSAEVRTYIKDKDYPFYGQFDPYLNRIMIFRSETETLDKYIKVFIHEWTHSIQKKLKKNYLKMDSKYGYSKNPFEVEARENEKIFKSIIWKYTKYKLMGN